MNARTRLFVSLARRGPAQFASAGALAAVLSGCAVAGPFASAPVDPASPIAAEVAAKARAGGPYPDFNDIPKTPTDVRPAEAWRNAAADTEGARLRIERETAPGTWSLDSSDAFAERARAAAGPEGSAYPAQDTEAFARSLRDRATPPPPPR